MGAEVHKLIYCSRSRLKGSARDQEVEITRLLEKARVYNARHYITGALLFNSGCFAQALEGPRAAVDALFERIQRDPRHGDIVVVRNEPGGRRDFPDWSMAHAQCESEDGYAAASAALEMALARRTILGTPAEELVRKTVVELLRTLVVRQLDPAIEASELLSSHQD